MKKIKKYLKKFIFILKISYLIKVAKSYIISDEKYYKNEYKKLYKKELDLDNIETFNGRVIYRILKEKKEIYTKLTDKYLVREYVKEKIGDKFLIKLHGVYNSVNEIDYNSFPKSFVLKCTHDCGSTIIVDNKKNLNIKYCNRLLEFYFKRNFYYISREWHYKNIKPRIICEEKLVDATDYKFHCFYGKVGHVEVIFDRLNDKKINEYDEKGNILSYKVSGCDNIDKTFKLPQNFEQMIEIAEKLSQDFDYCRVDLYNNIGKIKFGEITFTPAAGLDILPYELDLKLRKLWK